MSVPEGGVNEESVEDEPVITPFAFAIVESPAIYTVGARFESSPLGAANTAPASASRETTCEYNILTEVFQLLF
ncbi:MAG: hypothetical protein EOO27_51355 [Comamonadaceae bacterium]|nr:MAG: hypothetical protein EOO27_51355 [Comamonadaceae bacterium]